MPNVRPEIVGLSPSFASSVGGSKVTVRGQNLGIDADDLIGVTICGIDHLHKTQWISPYKLQITTHNIQMNDFPNSERGADGLRILSGPVLVSTASAGQSHASLSFKFVEQEEEGEIDSETELDEWTDVPDRRLRDGADSAVRTAVVIETVSDPLCIYKDKKKENRKTQTAETETIVDDSILDSLREMYPLGNSDPASTNFVPAWFLAEKHSNTPLHLLMVGSENLDALIAKQEHAVTSLMKDNFDRYVACQDAILNVQGLLSDDQALNKGDLTSGLRSNQQAVYKMSADYIKPLLARRDRAEAIRSVSSVLNRYKFLIGLPNSMRLAITNGQYSTAVTDYEKAISLYSHSNVPFVKTVLAEVESIASNVRTTLLNKLRQPRASMSDRELYIDYLLRLGSIEDPSCMVIGYVRDGLCLMLNTCGMKFHAIPENEETIQRGRELFESIEFEGFVVKEEDWSSKEAFSIISYVSDLSRIVSTLFPRLWKIYRMYCESQRSTNGPTPEPDQGIGSGSMSNLSSSKSFKGEKGTKSNFSSSVKSEAKDVKPGGTNFMQVEDVVGPVLLLYEKLIRSAFQLKHNKENETEEEYISPFAEIIHNCDHETSQALLQCVMVISQLLRQLNDLEGVATASKKYMRMLTKLQSAYRVFCVGPVLEEAHDEVLKLMDWKLTVSVGVSVTELPDEFNSIIQACIDDLAPVLVENCAGSMGEPSNAVVIVRDKIASLFHDFTGVLRHHAFLDDVPQRPLKRKEQYENLHGALFQTMTLELLAFESQPPSRSQRLLIILGSINYLIDITLPMLGQMFEKKFHCSLFAMTQVPLRTLKLMALDINDDYVRTNTRRLIAIIDEGLNDTSLLQNSPRDVRQYVKHVILGLVTVHSEVTSIDRSYCRTMIEGLQDNISEGICIIVDGLDIDLLQYQQIHIDLKVLSLAMGNYNTRRSMSLMDNAFKILKTKVRECKPYISSDEADILEQFEHRMTFTLKCLDT
eukprot:CFRG4259T1